MIRIEPEPWAAMVAHARRDYPNECCGAMLGASADGTKTVREAITLKNAFAGAQAAQRLVERRPLPVGALRRATARPAHPGVDLVFDAVVIGRAHEDAGRGHGM